MRDVVGREDLAHHAKTRIKEPVLIMPIVTECIRDVTSISNEDHAMCRQSRRVQLVLGVILSTLSAGCAEDIGVHRPPSPALSSKLPPQPQPIHQASASDTEDVETPSVSVETLFGESKTLSPARLIEVVVERNPTLDQMRAAALAAQSRYDQVTSLDDPMLGITSAPGSIGSNNAAFANRVELTQKIPFSGKRDLRGQVATAEASAATREVDDSRLQLIESAMNAYADYSFTEQASIVNKENLTILGEIRKNAETKYKNNQAPQQDMLQADVEIARQQERGVTLERMSRVARARLNTLMHLPPDAALPPPDRVFAVTETSNPAELRARALAARPDLKTLADRIAADEASLALALREYKPDVEVLAAYDGFWQGDSGRPLQWQIGAKINLPVRTSRRHGAVAEAQARLAQRRAELARLTDQVNLQVQESYELLQESDKIIRLYDKTLLPAAEANVKEARTSYVNGKVPFLSLAEAQRGLVSLKDRYFEAQADAVRRRATLDRALGGAN